MSDYQKPSYFPTDKMFGPNRTEYRLIDAVWNPPTEESPEYWECKQKEHKHVRVS